MVSLSALCLLVCLAVTTVHGLAPDDANVCQVTKTYVYNSSWTPWRHWLLFCLQMQKKTENLKMFSKEN